MAVTAPPPGFVVTERPLYAIHVTRLAMTALVHDSLLGLVQLGHRNVCHEHDI